MLVNFLQNPVNLSAILPFKKSENKSAIQFSSQPHDVVSFGAIKKSQLQGFDLACKEMFAPPLSKFKSTDDLKNWAQVKLDGYYDLNQYECRTPSKMPERKQALQEWKDYLQQKGSIYEKDPVLSLIIFSSITKDLNNTNDYMPPILKKSVLNQCVEELKEKLRRDKNYQFNFSKKYDSNLKRYYLQGDNLDYGPDAVKTGWVIIPQTPKRYSKNYYENADKLQAMSCKTWCTRNDVGYTHDQLERGDAHIYFENNRPKIIILLRKENEIYSLEGEKNDMVIPYEYLSLIKKYVKENNFKDVDSDIKKANKYHKKVKKIKADLKESIENKDYFAILEYFKYNPKYLKDNTISISHYEQPNEGDKYEDPYDLDDEINYLKPRRYTEYPFYILGIDENDLFKNISKIRGNANFQFSKLKKFETLRSIGGTAEFKNSDITDLGTLQIIGKDARLRDSKVEKRGKLKYIGKNAENWNCIITDWSGVKIKKINFASIT